MTFGFLVDDELFTVPYQKALASSGLVRECSKTNSGDCDLSPLLLPSHYRQAVEHYVKYVKSVLKELLSKTLTFEQLLERLELADFVQDDS